MRARGGRRGFAADKRVWICRKLQVEIEEAGKKHDNVKKEGVTF